MSHIWATMRIPDFRQRVWTLLGLPSLVTWKASLEKKSLPVKWNISRNLCELIRHSNSNQSPLRSLNLPRLAHEAM